MLLLRFNYDDIGKCRSVEDVFHMFGIGYSDDDEGYEVDLRDEKVFGKKGSYRNMFIADETYQAILDVLDKVPNYKGRKNPKGRASYAALQWSNYSPISNGPKFNQVKELVGGEINRSVLYILTPEDQLYEESPEV